MSWTQELENNLKWREDELAALKFSVAQTTLNTTPHRALLRAMWAMLYAHYEGFCIHALSVFLDEVQRSGVTRIQCEAPLMLFSLEDTFRKVRKITPNTPDYYTFCSMTFPTLVAARVDFQRDEEGEFVIKGRSNLYATHLLDHCKTMCLTETCIDANKKKLGLLVTRRNAIAHGKNEVVTNLAEYKLYEDAAIQVMHDLAVAIVDALNERSYLRPEFRLPLYAI